MQNYYQGGLGFGETKKTVHRSYDGCFLLLSWILQRCCTLFMGNVGAGMQQLDLCMDCNCTLHSLFLILSVHVQADS